MRLLFFFLAGPGLLFSLRLRHLVSRGILGAADTALAGGCRAGVGSSQMKTIARLSALLPAPGGTFEISMTLGSARADFCLRSTLVQIVGVKRTVLGGATIWLNEKTPGRFSVSRINVSDIERICDECLLFLADIKLPDSRRGLATLMTQQTRLLALLRRALKAPVPKPRQKSAPPKKRR